MTGTITVTASEASRVRQPGDALEVSFAWTLDETPRVLEARLFWFTQGKGTQDIAIADTQRVNPVARGEQRFRFKLPDAPYSFSGRLISLIWAVELVADDLAERWEFRLSPDGREILLDPPAGRELLPKSSDYARRR